MNKIMKAEDPLLVVRKECFLGSIGWRKESYDELCGDRYMSGMRRDFT